MYKDDPFSVIIERPPSSAHSSEDASSHASSGFAASSVMTVYRSPHQNGNAIGAAQPLLSSHKTSTSRNGVIPDDRKLSVIVDEERNLQRPVSYEYDFDEKVPDDYV